MFGQEMHWMYLLGFFVVLAGLCVYTASKSLPRTKETELAFQPETQESLQVN